MELNRRDFLKLTGATAGALILPPEALRVAAARAFPLHKPIGETLTICCYCGVGCGAIVASQYGQAVNIEGDPDHPINRGSLCSKGMSLSQIHTVDGGINPRRLQKVKYRAPGASTWEDKPWDWTLEQIARRVKATRDRYFVEKDSEGRTVNRVEAIASLGGAFAGQQRVLDSDQSVAFAWPGIHRTPGPYMTLRYRCGSGRVVR